MRARTPPLTAEEDPPSLRDIWRRAAQRDGLLPTERELAEELGIGRNAVREALIRLEADGLVARRHGAGTFANPAALEVQIRIDRTAEYADLLRGAGADAKVEVLEAEWVEPIPAVVDRLRLGPDAALYRTRKRWLAEGVPVMWAEDFIPARRPTDIEPSLSVFEIARTLNAQSTEWVCSWVEAVTAGELASVLDCPPTQPLLRLEQIGVSRDGTRCWLAFEHHNPARLANGLRYGLVRTMSSDAAGGEGDGQAQGAGQE